MRGAAPLGVCVQTAIFTANTSDIHHQLVATKLLGRHCKTATP